MSRSRLQRGFKNGRSDSRWCNMSRRRSLSGAMELFAGLIMVLALPLALASASKPLQVYFVDVEGGQSTLFVSPSGQSMLIDTGWPDHDGRDAKRRQVAEADDRDEGGYHQLHRAEAAALAVDTRLVNSAGASFEVATGRKIFANSRGFTGEYKPSYCSIAVSPIAQ